MIKVIVENFQSNPNLSFRHGKRVSIRSVNIMKFISNYCYLEHRSTLGNHGKQTKGHLSALDSQLQTLVQLYGSECY